MSADGLRRGLEMIRAHEGGYADHPSDPGGATNFGVSLRWLRRLGRDVGDVDHDGDIDADDVRALTWPMAERLFTTEFWDRYRYDRLPDDVGAKVFDLAVNCGPAQAHRLLQRACRAGSLPVDEDGVIGPKTLESVTAAQPHVLVACLRCEAAGFYRSLVAARPDLNVFIRGWLVRAYS